jgi:hypothetical protein
MNLIFPRYLACPSPIASISGNERLGPAAPMRQISGTIARHLSWKFTCGPAYESLWVLGYAAQHSAQVGFEA